MENPNTGVVNLRRHKSLQSSAQFVTGSSSSSSSSFSVGRKHSRLEDRSNPYVGWFRHSPSTRGFRWALKHGRSTTSAKKDEQCQMNLVKAASAAVAVGSMHSNWLKTSPYVGWFQQSLPRFCFDTPFYIAPSTNPFDYLLSLLRLGSSLAPDLTCGVLKYEKLLSGYLAGGGTDRTVSKTLDYHIQLGLASPSATVNILARLAYWLAFPFHDEMVTSASEKWDYSGCSGSIGKEDSVQASLSSIDEDELEEHSDGENDDDSEDEGVSAGSISSVSDASGVANVPAEEPLNFSISSQAQAYYAHQLSKELERPNQDLNQHSVPRYGEGEVMESPVDTNIMASRLDYDISQMDIVRMVRNANRHLDVESITKLPIITYNEHAKSDVTERNQRSHSEDNAEEKQKPEEWSWMLVDKGLQSEETETSERMERTKDEENMCVICLERFVDGDRLRVLPCNHSFHVGCIDRWLSGSNSFHACYTSGCPTCKKRPDEMSENDHVQDGSVPAWAFARIGDALARDTNHF